jgi:hypothetical protein
MSTELSKVPHGSVEVSSAHRRGGVVRSIDSAKSSPKRNVLAGFVADEPESDPELIRDITNSVARFWLED